MSGSTILNHNSPDLEWFLYALVGADRADSTVCVLSVVERLKLEPWADVAELATLGRNAAGVWLSLLLLRWREIRLALRHPECRLVFRVTLLEAS